MRNELLDELLGALRTSTVGALEALDGVIQRLERADAGLAERDAQVYQRALVEFADLDLVAFAELVTPRAEAAHGSDADAAGSA